MRWARTSAGLSHDRLVAALGRSNRSHVIKIEKGEHTPRRDLRDAWADATNVPRDLFDEKEDEEAPFRPSGSGRGADRAGAGEASGKDAGAKVRKAA